MLYIIKTNNYNFIFVILKILILIYITTFKKILKSA